jgi:hypothetical protein
MGDGTRGGSSGNGPGRDTSRTGSARPIILDLGGDGFDVSFTGTARFDMDGDCSLTPFRVNNLLRLHI